MVISMFLLVPLVPYGARPSRSSIILVLHLGRARLSDAVWVAMIVARQPLLDGERSPESNPTRTQVDVAQAAPPPAASATAAAIASPRATPAIVRDSSQHAFDECHRATFADATST